MHGPLNAHLHTDECNQLIEALMRCHTETNKISQLFGACNELDLAMRKCTKKERLKKIDENVAKAKERQKEMHKNYRDGMERMKRGEDI